MTNWESAKVSVGSNYPFDDEAYKVGLISVGLDPDAEMVAGKQFDLAVAGLILFLVTSPDLSEGGYRVQFDRDALLKVRNALIAKWDAPIPTGPTLRNRTYKW